MIDEPPVTPPQGWKFFAVSMVLIVGAGDGPRLLAVATLPLMTIIRLVFEFIAVIGLVRYAWGGRTTLFWRWFAPLFSIFAVYQLTIVTLLTVGAVMMRIGSLFAVMGLVAAGLPIVAVTWFLTIGLLRLARIVGTDRVPLGQRELEAAQLSLPL